MLLLLLGVAFGFAVEPGRARFARAGELGWSRYGFGAVAWSEMTVEEFQNVRPINGL